MRKGHQRPRIKDPWTKPWGVGLSVGCGGGGVGESDCGKMEKSVFEH